MRSGRSSLGWCPTTAGRALAVGWLLVARAAGAAEPPAAGVAPRPARAAGAIGPALAIPVEAGRASFDLPARPPGSQTLVIVSSLASADGSSPIRLHAEPIAIAPRPLPPAARPIAGPPPGVLPPVVPPPPPPPPERLPPAERTFHLMTRAGVATDPRNYRAILGHLHAVGRRIQVYVDRADEAAVDPEALREVVASFDHRVWPAVAGRFGPASDVDGDGRFTVLLTSWLDRLADGKVQVDGFVRGADLDRRQPAPFGNRADMMYLNAHLRAGPHLRTVVAHEYAHAVTFSRKVLDHAGGGPIDASTEEEGWLDEAIAHLVEDEVGFSRTNLDYRVSAFLSEPERYRLVVADYLAADLFRSHGNRGATYLFLRWAADRFGPRLLDALIRSPGHGVANLEAATGMSFADLFRAWTVALYRSGLDPQHPDPGDYRSLVPRGDRRDWLLAGPRAAVVAPGGRPDAWLAEGTSAHFALVGADAGRNPVRVEVEAPPGAALQVTVLPLPTDLARPELAVEPVAAAGGLIRVRARVVETGGSPVRLGALAWERLAPQADPHAPGFRRDALDPGGIAAAFGSPALAGWGAVDSRPIPLPGVHPGDGPLVFKVLGTDAKGRAVAGWARFDPGTRADALARGDAPR